jgi:hypothetical protein
VAKGFSHLTDELVYVPLDTREVHPFARPLSVKAAGLAALRGVLDLDAIEHEVACGSRTTLIPAGLLDRADHPQAPKLRAIVFPQFRAGTDFRHEDRSRGESALALMTCLINARNLPLHGLPQVTRLLEDVPSYRVTYGGFDQLEAWADRLLASEMDDRDVVSAVDE